MPQLRSRGPDRLTVVSALSETNRGATGHPRKRRGSVREVRSDRRCARNSRLASGDGASPRTRDPFDRHSGEDFFSRFDRSQSSKLPSALLLEYLLRRAQPKYGDGRVVGAARRQKGPRRGEDTRQAGALSSAPGLRSFPRGVRGEGGRTAAPACDIAPEANAPIWKCPNCQKTPTMFSSKPLQL